MNDSLGRVLVVTAKPRVAIQCHAVLRHFDATDYSVSPWFVPDAGAEAKDSRLVILDADSVLDWMDTVREACGAPRQLFVILARNISPRLVHDALSVGAHGLLSKALSTEETARALMQIRRGLYMFRFDRETEIPKAAAAAMKKSRRRMRFSCVCLD